MTTATATKKATAPKKAKQRKAYDGPSADEKLCQSLIELLEAGVNPWRKEWQGETTGPHRNLLTGRPYRGCNPLLLEMGLALRGTECTLWAGYAQAKAKGWIPRKGSKGVYILRPQLNSRTVEDENGRPAVDDNGDEQRHSWVSYRPACLFNAADLAGVDEASEAALQAAIAAATGAPAARPDVERHSGAETVLNGWIVETSFGGDRAYYVPSADRIQMPQREAFVGMDAFYATWAHECIHSTGHSSRLARTFGASKGDEVYAREELVAELGAFLLTRRMGIGSDAENHAAYLGHWAAMLKEGPKVLYKVLSDATKAAGLILPEAADDAVEVAE